MEETLKNIEHACKIEIGNVPVKWLPKIELFYPDLPGFPIIYVHTIVNNTRIYGFPVTMQVNNYEKDGTCNITFLFFCNLDLNNVKNAKFKEIIKKELENRIGISNPVTEDDIKNASPAEYKPFLSKLFNICTNLYGKKLPFGHFYEEVYSIIRFVAAFAPKTGRQSEMRMLYNFISRIGEPISIKIKKDYLKEWSFLEFYLVPTYSDFKNNTIYKFNKFFTLFNAIKKLWKYYFTEEITICDNKYLFAIKEGNCWEPKREDFVKSIKTNLVDKNIITANDQKQIELLVDIFNRYPRRASFFVWAICTLEEQGFENFDKEFFIKFYSKADKLKGCSQKVVACFLQQGFMFKNVIPIDTWVETFYKYALGCDSLEMFFENFENIEKLERLIWLVSQANKVNSKDYMELLWCQRFGTNNNKKFREMNPLSCYECKLHRCCRGYETIKSAKLLIKIFNEREWENYKNIAINNNCKFICIMDNDNVPQKIYKAKIKRNKIYDYELIDEFSSYLLNKTNSVKSSKDIMTVDEFIRKLPSFQVDIDKMLNSNLAQD